MAKFYGQFMVDSFKKQMKENRKIEELILMFATHATQALKKEPTLGADGWKLELNNQIAVFVKILQESLRSVNHVSPELQSRLDVYASKLAPSQAASDSGYETSSTTKRDSGSSFVMSHSVSDMTMVLAVGRAFKRSEAELQNEVDQLRQFCTEKVTQLRSSSAFTQTYAGSST